jgi:hypothetical protein
MGNKFPATSVACMSRKAWTLLICHRSRQDSSSVVITCNQCSCCQIPFNCEESYYFGRGGVDCSERDRLEKAVAQATLEWTVLDQTPLPDVSIPGGLQAAEDLTRRREGAREILNRARTAYLEHCRTHRCSN